MIDKKKDISASIMAKLKNVSRDLKLSFNLVMQLYIQERLLQRLSLSKYNNKFLLKGGLLLYSMSEFKGRPTKDIDFLAKNISNDLESIERAFTEICAIDIYDGVVFDIGQIKSQRINKNADYEGVRSKIVAYIGRARVHIQIDIGFGDVIIPKPVKIKYPVLLNFENPEINVYSYDSVIAEKFEALVSLSLLNSRMKDFYDIYILLNEKEFDGRVLQEAIFETFQRRGTILEKTLIIFTDGFIKDKDRNKQWKLFLDRIGKNNLELSEVVTKIKKFIKPIYDSIVEEEEFQYQWNCQNKCWRNYT